MAAKIPKEEQLNLHLGSDLYSSHCMVCPQYELPVAPHQQRWRDTEQEKSGWITCLCCILKGPEVINIKKSEKNQYLKFWDIQRTALLPDDHKLNSDVLLLRPAWGWGAAREDGEGPGDGTGGGKHIRTLTHHLERKQIYHISHLVHFH